MSRVISCVGSLVVAAGVAAAALEAQRGAPAPDTAFHIEGLATPAGTDSGSMQLTVSGGRALLSWVETRGEQATVRFSERTPAGWSAARVIVAARDLFVNSADVPSVLALADGTLAAQWLQMNGNNPEGYDLRLSRSTDDGRTWSAPTTPHHDGTPTQHGFASLFQAPGAGLGVAWLDGRETDPEAPEGQNGNMTLRAAVFGRDGVQASEALVDGRVCDCCPIATAAVADGVLVAYRDRSPDEVRDIMVSRLAAGTWSAPARVHADGWKIAACPVNGPSLSARGRDVAVGWFTVRGGQGQSYVAFSNDAGRSFGIPHRVDDDSSLGRVQVALLDDGSAAVSWIEYARQLSDLRVRRVARDGSRSAPTVLAAGLGRNHPRMVRHGRELIFAWPENTRGTTRVRTARASLDGGGRPAAPR
jgi:hypothetical protein